MTEQEQRIAIAEFSGWKHIKGEEPTIGGTYKQAGWKSPGGTLYPSDWDRKSAFGLPDYLHDLNAMHEAFLALSDDDQMHFLDFLSLVTGHDKTVIWAWRRADVVITMFKATAAQRAEALLKTIGKWKE